MNNGRIHDGDSGSWLDSVCGKYVAMRVRRGECVGGGDRGRDGDAVVGRSGERGWGERRSTVADRKANGSSLCPDEVLLCPMEIALEVAVKLVTASGP